MKPGYKTTEFWLTLLVTVLGAAMASGLIPEGGLWAKVVGAAMSVLGALGYQASRTFAKRADTSLRASPNWEELKK